MVTSLGQKVKQEIEMLLLSFLLPDKFPFYAIPPGKGIRSQWKSGLNILNVQFLGESPREGLRRRHDFTFGEETLQPSRVRGAGMTRTSGLEPPRRG